MESSEPVSSSLEGIRLLAWRMLKGLRCPEDVILHAPGRATAGKGLNPLSAGAAFQVISCKLCREVSGFRDFHLQDRKDTGCTRLVRSLCGVPRVVPMSLLQGPRSLGIRMQDLTGRRRRRGCVASPYLGPCRPHLRAWGLFHTEL